jgi:hypothetical protein
MVQVSFKFKVLRRNYITFYQILNLENSLNFYSKSPPNLNKFLWRKLFIFLRSSKPYFISIFWSLERFFLVSQSLIFLNIFEPFKFGNGLNRFDLAARDSSRGPPISPASPLSRAGPAAWPCCTDHSLPSAGAPSTDPSPTPLRRYKKHQSLPLPPLFLPRSTSSRKELVWAHTPSPLSLSSAPVIGLPPLLAAFSRCYRRRSPPTVSSTPTCLFSSARWSLTFPLLSSAAGPCRRPLRPSELHHRLGRHLQPPPPPVPCHSGWAPLPLLLSGATPEPHRAVSAWRVHPYTVLWPGLSAGPGRTREAMGQKWPMHCFPFFHFLFWDKFSENHPKFKYS